MSDQDGMQPTTLQRPATTDRTVWQAFWKEQGQSWRTEPEIAEERQTFLRERCCIVPDIKQGIYPFKDIKLSRSDVEWLLARHENGRGPVDWSDENQRKREGLDLRGADLSKADLSYLPLASIQAGLTGSEWFYSSPEQGQWAAAHLENVILIGAHLESAKFNDVSLKRANLYQAHLEGAEVKYAHLEGAYLNESHLGGASFSGSHLEGTDLRRAHLEGISTLPATLRGVFFDNTTKLTGAILGNAMNGFVQVVDISWGGVNLALLDWSSVNILGDEGKARQSKQLDDYEKGVRANRQLAVALQTQGLNELAARFAYRAQKLQRIVLRRQKKFGQYLLSLLLDLLAGYGYKPGRSVLIYLLVVFAAFEAVIGLFIEISFIATFTRRFFGS